MSTANDQFYAGEASSVAFSPDGYLLAVILDDRLHVWNLKRSEEVQWPLSINSDAVRAIFSSEGILALLQATDTIALIDSTTGQKLSTVHAEGVEQIAFSPDGSALITSIANGPIKFWAVPAK